MSVLENVSVVIPTNRETNHTIETIPEECEVLVRKDEGLNVARNRGVARASNDWIVIADDDIDFPTKIVEKYISGMHKYHLAGLEDFWPLDWIIGRLMIFHKSLWAKVGGFDESRPHGGDTDFAVRCDKEGARVLRLPRQIVPHYDEDGEFNSKEHIEWLFYLSKRHPVKVGLKIPKYLYQYLYSSYQNVDY